jgi:hypothetical protein
LSNEASSLSDNLRSTNAFLNLTASIGQFALYGALHHLPVVREVSQCADEWRRVLNCLVGERAALVSPKHHKRLQRHEVRRAPRGCHLVFMRWYWIPARRRSQRRACQSQDGPLQLDTPVTFTPIERIDGALSR